MLLLITVIFDVQSFGWIFVSMVDVTTELYRKIKDKWEKSEGEIKKLRTKLQKRDQQLHSLDVTIVHLKDVTNVNERRLEMQSNQLEEQRAMLREMYTALKMKEGFSYSSVYLNLEEMTAKLGETSQAYRVLRKHRRHLVFVTKPFIQEIIDAALEADLVSIHMTMSLQGDNCTDEFYKALQVKVMERPDALKTFVTILRVKSTSCQQLCNTILKEIETRPMLSVY